MWQHVNRKRLRVTTPELARAWRALLIVAALFAPAGLARADEDPPDPRLVPPAPLNEQVLHLPTAAAEHVDLVVTLYMPPGAGRFPLAVMNHGSNGSRERPAETPRYRFTMSAYYFLSRGYAVALPMMRGYGGSGGHQSHYGCDLAHMALNNGRDIAAVIEDLASNPQIDTERVVVAGQSFGGWNTLGLGAINPPAGVRGLIDFVGGVRSSACRGQAGGESLVEGAGRLGGGTGLPSLWFYGENDSLFGPDIWRPMYRAYTEQGGHAELVDVGSFMDDSHKMLSRPESIPLWAPRIDAFLTRIGLPGRAVFPQYMPRPWPRPSGFAALDDAAAVPWVNARSRDAYRKFLTIKPPRVFAVAPGGQSATTQGGFDPVGRALDRCRSAGFACVPYAIDSDVVFVRPPAAVRPPATHFAALDDVAAVPWLHPRGRALYAHFLTTPLPRAFVVAPGGQAAATQGGYDPLGRALAECRAAGVACRPYAVNNQVVWVRPRP